MKRCPQCNRVETDESLKFCRVDGATLVSDSSSIASEAGTAQLGESVDASELHTSVLPHRTSAGINHPQTPTTVLPPLSPSGMTGEFHNKEKRLSRKRLAVIGTAIVAVVTAVVVISYRPSSRTAPIESIAVMPFINESGNPEVEYLSDGMTEVLIGSLSNLPNLNVKARTSVFRYKGKQIDPRQIASDLNVQAVVTGRIVQRANNLALYVELIDAATENVLWKADYNRSMTDLVALQNEIAQDISQKLRTKLTPADTQKLTKRNETANPEAYRLYLQGRYFWNKRRIGEMGKAIGYFQQAIDLDPNYALAYAGLADAVAQPNDVVPHLERREKARAAIQKALSLDPDLAEAHTSLAHLLTRYDMDFAGAERELNRSLELDPKWIDSYQRLGELYTFQGKSEESLNWFRKGLEIEPFNVPLNTAYGGALYCARQYDEALAQLKKTTELDPNHRNAHVLLYQVYGMKRMYAEAVGHRVTALRLANQNEWADNITAGFAKSGWPGVLREELKRFSMIGNSPDRLPHYNEAVVLALLGESDKAFDALEKSVESSEQPALVFLKVDPRFDPLRPDPRFKELLRRLRFPE